MNYLPESQILDFHDANIIGNVKPNIEDESFSITIRMLRYEKLEDTFY